LPIAALSQGKTSGGCYPAYMDADSNDIDLRWKEFAANHGMEEYRHGHGLLRGCCRQFEHIRFAVNERPQGVDFTISGSRRPVASLFWADRAFLQWCRLPPQVEAAEKAYATASRLGLLQSAWDELKVRPYRADDSPLIEPSLDLSRFRRLGGSCNATDLCDPAILAALPVNVVVENDPQRLHVYFPTVLDPDLPLPQIAQIAGLRL
jgi:hypothetical protein